jgi:pimeloyl-ACP methyl ester carboxylesterase
MESTASFVETVASRARLLIPKSMEASIADTAQQILAPAWLARPDDVHLPDPASMPRVGPPAPPGTAQAGASAQGKAGDREGRYLLFANNYQRFVAQEMHKRLDSKRFSNTGFLLQLTAAGWHRKSPAQLAQLGDRVGRDRILVMHGTEDNMISLQLGRKLIEYLRPETALIVEGMGHAAIMERWEWYNSTVEEQFAKGEKLDGRA